jgi:uncharacterized protein
VRSPAQILAESKTIALVGASPKPDRPANGVMRYLMSRGYRVIPVRPLNCDEVHGVPCVSSLREIEEPIDLVDVFRRAEACPEVAREAAEVGARAVWLQLGLVSPEAREIATEAGMDYVENECTAIVHRRCLVAWGNPGVPPRAPSFFARLLGRWVALRRERGPASAPGSALALQRRRRMEWQRGRRR